LTGQLTAATDGQRNQRQLLKHTWRIRNAMKRRKADAEMQH